MKKPAEAPVKVTSRAPYEKPAVEVVAKWADVTAHFALGSGTA